MTPTLREQFDDIDIYLFDQLLRGRHAPGMRVLDAGCGRGRNLVYLLRAGSMCRPSTPTPRPSRRFAHWRHGWRRGCPVELRVERVEAMTVPDGAVDVIISSAVLHFANDHAHFDVDGAADVAGARTGWIAVLPPGRVHRDRAPYYEHGVRPVLAA